VFNETKRWKSRWKVRDLLADGRCSQAVLDFLTSTDVGRRVPAEEEAVSAVSEAELRDREQGQGRGAGRLAGITTVPAHAWLHGVRRRGLGGSIFICLSHLSFFCDSLGALHFLRGQAWAEGKVELATCRHCADSRQETDCT